MLEFARPVWPSIAEDGARRAESPGMKQSFYKPSDRAMISRWISEAPP